MHRCLELARLGLGSVSPNPLVGAVLVHGDTIIGEGYHQQFGQAHAEVNCLNSVPSGSQHLIPESTLYVSLEPCAHHGKTPPCTDLILRYGIKKVIIGTLDPFEQVNGKGAAKLRESGVEVVTGVLEEWCQFENRRFLTFHTKQRPYIILKWVQTADKRIAGPAFKRIFISGEETNRLSHRWRTEEDAIMVGFHTALHDNPSLTNRYWKGKNPVRVFFDRHLQIPQSHHLLDGSVQTIVFNAIKSERNSAVEYLRIRYDSSWLGEALQCLHARNISSLIVEGGARLLQSFLNQSLWDEARIITNADLRLGEGLAAPQWDFSRHILKEQQTLSSDRLEVYLNDIRKS